MSVVFIAFTLMHLFVTLLGLSTNVYPRNKLTHAVLMNGVLSSITMLHYRIFRPKNALLLYTI